MRIVFLCFFLFTSYRRATGKDARYIVYRTLNRKGKAMSEEIMNKGRNTQSGNMGNETVQGSDQDGNRGDTKLFTQKEVNDIVQSRIARVKDQAEKELETEYSQKMEELQKRELQLLVKESLNKRGMSSELADIITCTDAEDLNKKLDTLQKIYGEKDSIDKNGGDTKVPGIRIGVVRNSGVDHRKRGTDPIREAMGLPERNER